jgi:hypothetical protein
VTGRIGEQRQDAKKQEMTLKSPAINSSSHARMG